MNEVMNAILSRSTTRKYTDEPLTEEEIKTLKAAALASPTAMNAQNTRYIFITDKQLMKDFDAAIMEGLYRDKDQSAFERAKSRGSILYEPPLLIIIVNKPGEHYGDINAGIAVQNLCLAAESLGLGSVILGMPNHAFFDEQKAKVCEMLHFPEGYEFSIAVSIGHRAMEKAPHIGDESHILEF